jgi:hypothetical protein
MFDMPDTTRDAVSLGSWHFRLYPLGRQFYIFIRLNPISCEKGDQCILGEPFMVLSELEQLNKPVRTWNIRLLK